jgi:hypothetical protein
MAMAVITVEIGPGVPGEKIEVLDRWAAAIIANYGGAIGWGRVIIMIRAWRYCGNCAAAL